jgi:hypothetical protein
MPLCGYCLLRQSARSSPDEKADILFHPLTATLVGSGHAGLAYRARRAFDVHGRQGGGPLPHFGIATSSSERPPRRNGFQTAGLTSLRE